MRDPLNVFLMNVGRKKFVVPLYGALLKNPADASWARSLYLKARPRYHPDTQGAVDKLMKQ